MLNALKEAYKVVRHRFLFGNAGYTEVFQRVYERRLWLSDESHSGLGSTLVSTECLRPALGAWLRAANVRSFIDLPCGDFNWMRHVEFPADMTYLGLDIIPELVTANQAAHATAQRQFGHGDILLPPLLLADAYFCRDLLGHFPNAAVERALANIRAARPVYFLATTFPGVAANRDTRFPDFRRHNLALHLGEPEALLPDFAEGAPDKYIGIWRLS